MAKQTIVTLTDDLDPSIEADETVDFALDGKRFEIDLSAEHATNLRDVLAPYVTAARKAGGGGGHKPVKPEPGGKHRMDREETAAIRQWVRDNGGEVKDRGRISRDYVDAYQKRDTSIFEQAKTSEPELQPVGAGAGDPFMSTVHF